MIKPQTAEEVAQEIASGQRAAEEMAREVVIAAFGFEREQTVEAIARTIHAWGARIATEILEYIGRCRCDSAWTDRKRHAPECEGPLREDIEVEILAREREAAK